MRNRTVPEAGISRNYKIARGKPAGGEVVYEDCADSARSNKGKYLKKRYIGRTDEDLCGEGIRN